MKKAYIAGKITGLPKDDAYIKFEIAADELRRQGLEPTHGFDINAHAIANNTHTWESCMRQDIKVMMECDEVHMLPCWQESRGAQIEHDIALRLGMTVVYH